jgi:hypothetical protein
MNIYIQMLNFPKPHHRLTNLVIQHLNIDVHCNPFVHSLNLIYYFSEHAHVFVNHTSKVTFDLPIVWAQSTRYLNSQDLIYYSPLLRPWQKAYLNLGNLNNACFVPKLLVSQKSPIEWLKKYESHFVIIFKNVTESHEAIISNFSEHVCSLTKSNLLFSFIAAMAESVSESWEFK